MNRVRVLVHTPPAHSLVEAEVIPTHRERGEKVRSGEGAVDHKTLFHLELLPGHPTQSTVSLMRRSCDAMGNGLCVTPKKLKSRSRCLARLTADLCQGCSPKCGGVCAIWSRGCLPKRSHGMCTISVCVLSVVTLHVLSVVTCVLSAVICVLSVVTLDVLSRDPHLVLLCQLS